MSNDDSQLLMQASQIAGNLRERMAEQSRRENHISDQLASLDQEQRQLRLAQQQFEEDRQDRDAALKRREGEYAAKLADAEKLLTDLQNRETTSRAAKSNWKLLESDSLKSWLISWMSIGLRCGMPGNWPRLNARG